MSLKFSHLTHWDDYILYLCVEVYPTNIVMKNSQGILGYFPIINVSAKNHCTYIIKFYAHIPVDQNFETF